MVARSDPFIHVPANLIFTREGLALLKNSNSVKRVVDRKGVQREGLSSSSYNAPTVQKMIMNSYLEEIYVCLPDLLRKRYEIISTNNLIVYAILYKKLTPSLAKMFFESQVVKDFNRKNPKNSIVDLKHISKSATEKLLTAKRDLFNEIEREIRSAVIDLIAGNAGLSEEDKTERFKSLPKFIDWIDNRIWYLYFIVYQTPLKDQMRRSFARMIASYLEHTGIATHLSNLLMEFVQNAEKAHLERLIIRNHMATSGEIDKFLRDRDNRDYVIKEAIRQNQMVEVSWSMNPERSSIGHQYRISINVSNYGIINEKTRRGLTSKMKTNIDGIGLAQFYESNSDDPDKLGAGLGLLYNSYLEDICKKEGILYKCNIFPEPEKERTTVRIDLTL